MSLETVRDVFLRCFLYGILLLALWFFVYVFAGNWMYDVHQKFFSITRYQFSAMNYFGMVRLKMTLIVFFLLPSIAMTVTMAAKKK